MHILLVEDDAMLADAVCDGARRNGWQIDHAFDAASARLLQLDTSYSVILLDLGLSRESGPSLLNTMRTRYDVTPVLVLTARGQLSERIAGAAAASACRWWPASPGCMARAPGPARPAMPATGWMQTTGKILCVDKSCCGSLSGG